MPATKQRAFTLVELLVVIANGGCSNQGLVDVHGSVTLDGKPLPGGIIAFEPVDGNGATAGGEIRAGKYELTGKAAVPPGEKTVRLTGVFKTGRQIEPARF